MAEMNTSGAEKRGILTSAFCIILVLLMIIIPPPISADGPTLVQVNPASKTVSAGQTFIISISCTPGQTIKSYELKLSFNTTLLHANTVTEGTIFTGYTTFFNPGTINNTAGTIVDVYGLIVGAGGVTNPGTLVSLSFTAQAASGTTTIGLFDVGITNDTAYVPITVTNGTVTLREFTLTITLDGSGSVTKNLPLRNRSTTHGRSQHRVGVYLLDRKPLRKHKPHVDYHDWEQIRHRAFHRKSIYINDNH
jgi:hypothetical protein